MGGGRRGGEEGVGGGRGEAKREGGEKRKILHARSARRSRMEEGDKGAGGGGKGAGGGRGFPPLSAPSDVVTCSSKQNLTGYLAVYSHVCIIFLHTFLSILSLLSTASST